MAIKAKNGYSCGYCHKSYKNQVEADNCKSSHKLVYVSISREDLGRLINFIYTKEDALLSDNLVERLQSYLKNTYNPEEDNVP